MAPPTPDRWWIDTNLVVRLVTGDPPAMAEQAARFFELNAGKGTPLRLDPLVVAEALYVLTSFYKLSRVRAVEALLGVVGLPGLRVERRDLVVHSLKLHAETPKLHFLDAWLATKAEAGGDGVATFDAGIAKAAAVPVWNPGEADGAGGAG